MYGCSGVVGCMIASVSLVSKGIDAIVVRTGLDANVAVQCLIRNGLSATATRVGKGLEVSVSLVCSVAEVVDNYIPFLVKEGDFILLDGKQFKVLRYELSE